jgi:hypothetical protein
MTTAEIEAAKLEIERQRFALDQTKAQHDNTFLKRNAGVIISAAVSFAAVVVSVGQVWSTQISRDNELQIAREQHARDTEQESTRRDREFALTDAQRKRELDIQARRLVLEFGKTLFEGTASAESRNGFALVLATMFPPEVSQPLLRQLQRSASPENKPAFDNAAQLASQQADAISPDRKRFLTIRSGHVQIWDADSGRQLLSLTPRGLPTGASFSPDGKTVRVEEYFGGWQVFDLPSGRVLNEFMPPTPKGN